MNTVVSLVDSSCVARARRGDHEAFTQLVEQHHARVWRFLLKWVGNRHDADELVQETFLAAWQRLPGFRGESQFATWLLGIAINLARNHRNRDKAKHAEIELPDDDFLGTLLAAHPDPLSLMQQKSTLAALDQAIARLPEDMRDVMRLVKLEGLSLELAASVLGIPAGTVKSRLSRAKERLLAELKDYLT
jgi:RNA polymerase sigma-70 factor (ECF subfamily)